MAGTVFSAVALVTASTPWVSTISFSSSAAAAWPMPGVSPAASMTQSVIEVSSTVSVTVTVLE